MPLTARRFRWYSDSRTGRWPSSNEVELLGFKSFPERTIVDFAAGISAVVGPNGCGKSNVVDAIRWALGEQNPRALRVPNEWKT